MKQYFISSNSSKGYVRFYDSNLRSIDRLMQTRGFHPEVMEQAAKEFEEAAKKKGYDIELIRCCLDNSVEGVLIPGAGVGLLNTPLYIEENANACEIRYGEKIALIDNYLDLAYDHFATALTIHDQWEKIYISNLNFEVLNDISSEYIEKIVGSRTGGPLGQRKDRYFGAATVRGAVDYISDITQDIQKRYFIKGRPGTGKSTFLKKIASAALAAGYDTEVYHCAFDPDSLDLVSIPALSVCLFDSTAPHEYFPSREGDEIIDIYEMAVTTGTDEAHKSDLTALSACYKNEVAMATKQLVQVNKQYYSILEELRSPKQLQLIQEFVQSISF